MQQELRSVSRRALLGTVAAVGLIASLGGAAIAQPQPGKAAPDFTAVDSKGKTVRLSELKGKTVVLEWTNQDCPYVRKHYETSTMQSLQRDATADGVVWLTVSSSAPGFQGHVNALEAEKLTADRKAAPTAFLLDPEGKIGRAYEARVTPHMFVIDKAGLIAYMGAIDDRPTANHDDVKGARAYVREALSAIKSGQPVRTTSTRPYGCSVKYAPARS